MRKRSLQKQFLYLYYAMEKDEVYKDIISMEGRRRRDRRIPRCALRSYAYSSFRTLYLSGNDQALLNLTGFDHSTFLKLVTKFKPVYDFYTFDTDTGLIRKKY